METKRILLANGEVKEMNKEEVLHQFKNLLYKTAQRYTVDGYDFEDLYQEASITLLEAFDEYDEENAFLVHIKWKLKQRMSSLISKTNAKKRESEKGRTSFDIELGEEGGNTLYDLIEDGTNIEVDFEQNEFVKFVNSKLDSSEKKTLLVMLGEINNSTVADAEGVSRQAITNRIAKLKKKLVGIVGEYHRQVA